MKYLISLLLIVSNLAIADCNVKSASRLANEHSVGTIENLVKQKKMGQCIVEFDIDVDGETHHLREIENGLEQEESLCYYAQERARKNLLLSLGGKFLSEAVTTCVEGVEYAQPKRIKKGDVILEAEVGKVGSKDVPEYFKWRNQTCRMFVDRYVDNKRINRADYGVICQANGSDTNWRVIDKW